MTETNPPFIALPLQTLRNRMMLSLHSQSCFLKNYFDFFSGPEDTKIRLLAERQTFGQNARKEFLATTCTIDFVHASAHDIENMLARVLPKGHAISVRHPTMMRGDSLLESLIYLYYALNGHPTEGEILDIFDDPKIKDGIVARCPIA